MLTFRIAITAAVMAFITAVVACLILIQIETFHAAAKAAASAAMDAASRNSRTRFDAELAELSATVRLLSTDPSIADSDERSETDRAIVLFKTALQVLPQTDSIYVGYDNGCWLQVRRLDTLDPAERRKLNAVRRTSTRAASREAWNGDNFRRVRRSYCASGFCPFGCLHEDGSFPSRATGNRGNPQRAGRCGNAEMGWR